MFDLSDINDIYSYIVPIIPNESYDDISSMPTSSEQTATFKDYSQVLSFQDKKSDAHINSIMSIGAVAGFLYMDPLSYGLELGFLLSDGILTDIVKTNSDDIAQTSGLNKDLIRETAKFFNDVRWPIIGIAVGITSSSVIKQYTDNPIIAKTVSTVVASVFSHAYMNMNYFVKEAINGITEYNYDTHIDNIFGSNAKRDLLSDTIFFGSIKFVDEVLKCISKIESYNLTSNFLITALHNSVFRSIANQVGYTILNESSSHIIRHIELPLEFLTKSTLETFNIGNTYMNSIIPSFVGNVVKKIYPLVKEVYMYCIE